MGVYGAHWCCAKMMPLLYSIVNIRSHLMCAHNSATNAFSCTTLKDLEPQESMLHSNTFQKVTNPTHRAQLVSAASTLLVKFWDIYVYMVGCCGYANNPLPVTVKLERSSWSNVSSSRAVNLVCAYMYQPSQPEWMEDGSWDCVWPIHAEMGWY